MKLTTPSLRWILLLALSLGVSLSTQAQGSFSAALTTFESNGVAIFWPAEISGAYNLLTTTGPEEPWQPLFAEPIFAPLNRVTVHEPLNAAARQFRVVRLDTVAPVVWDASPLPGAVGVSRHGPIIVSVSDDGTIDTNSISIVLTNGPPLTLANSPLRFVSGVLTFDPGTNALGSFGQVISVVVTSRDIAGNAFTNTWTFQLEDPPVPDPDVIAVSNAPPGLVLIAALDDALTYTFSGETSGLAPGAILVSEDPTFPYRRLVVLVHEEPAAHEVTVITTNAPLSDSLDSGGAQVGGEVDPTPFILAALPPGGPFNAAALPECCSVNLSNRTIAPGPDLNARVSGVVELQPRVAARGVFNPSGLAAMDFEFGGRLVTDLLLEAEGHAAGSFTNRLALGSARKVFPPVYAGPVPVSSSVTVAFDLVLESSWQQPGTLRLGLTETNLLSVAAQLRGETWTASASGIRRFSLPTPSCETNPAAQLRLFIEERLTMDLDNAPAIALTLRPGLEAVALASAPPGMIGCDLTLFKLLTATLAIHPSSWDPGAPSLPATNIVSSREFLQHSSEFIRLGATLAVQPVPGMLWIPPGTFQMGGSPTNLPTQVVLTQGFFIGRCELTQREFGELIATNVSFFHGETWGTNLARPMDSVSWLDATNYCGRLTLQEQGAHRIPANYAYRLPTEAEWEYAARAGTTNAFSTGDILPVGWANFGCDGDLQSPCPTNPIFGVLPPGLPRQNQPVAVGLFGPNRWGLQDVSGNLQEWCLDWLGDPLPGGTLTDPRGTNTTLRALRGGSFSSSSSACGSSSRLPAPSAFRASDAGFRLVLAPAPLAQLESYTVTFRAGVSLVANQLNHPVNNRVSTLFTNGTPLTISKWNAANSNYDMAVFIPGPGWDDPTSLTLNPGEAAVLDNSSGAPLTLTFIGERVVNFSRALHRGLQLISRPIPEPGTYETIALEPPVPFVTVSRANAFGGFDMYIYDPDSGGWSPSEPMTAIGEGLWVDVP